MPNLWTGPDAVRLRNNCRVRQRPLPRHPVDPEMPAVQAWESWLGVPADSSLSCLSFGCCAAAATKRRQTQRTHPLRKQLRNLPLRRPTTWLWYQREWQQ